MPRDDELFESQERLQEEKRQFARTQRNQPIHAKTTFAALNRTAVPADITGNPTWRNPLRKETSDQVHTEAEAAAIRPEKLWKRESAIDLVAQKREMFHVQLGIDIKGTEIAKLKAAAQQREAALTKGEKLLEEDSKRFEEFLADNSVKLQEAIAKVETETRAKQEKIAEIQRRQAAIAAMRSDLSRSEEQLEDAKRLQKFLEDLTPPEWRESLVHARDARHEQKLADWRAECNGILRQQQDAKDAKAQAEHDYDMARTQQEADKAQAAIKAAAAALLQANALTDPPLPELEPLDEEAFYFQEPGQLLDILESMEAQNLALIQSTQEARTALEAAVAKQRMTNARLEKEHGALHAQVQHLEERRDEEAQLCSHLKGHSLEVKGTDSAAGSSDEEWTELANCVAETYTQCGFHKDAKLSTVEMMAAIEHKLDDCIRIAAKMPPGVVEEGEKAREKERRQVGREVKKKAEEDEYKAKMERAELRAAAPAFKRAGKPPMTRSHLHKKAATDNALSSEKAAETELQNYIQRSFP